MPAWPTLGESPPPQAVSTVADTTAAEVEQICARFMRNSFRSPRPPWREVDGFAGGILSQSPTQRRGGSGFVSAWSLRGLPERWWNLQVSGACCKVRELT